MKAVALNLPYSPFAQQISPIYIAFPTYVEVNTNKSVL